MGSVFCANYLTNRPRGARAPCSCPSTVTQIPPWVVPTLTQLIRLFSQILFWWYFCGMWSGPVLCGNRSGRPFPKCSPSILQFFSQWFESRSLMWLKWPVLKKLFITSSASEAWNEHQREPSSRIATPFGIRGGAQKKRTGICMKQHYRTKCYFLLFLRFFR